ncbi:MAG: SAM-dependent methyltransferase [Desulfovermiculus sp.]
MIPFREFFQDWLYGENGYYAQYQPIGKKGDFYTSVTASPYFGGSIAWHLIHQIQHGTLPEDIKIIEFGAHQGYLITDFIHFLHILAPHLLDTLSFTVVEHYESLRCRQDEHFRTQLGPDHPIVQVADISEAEGEWAFILANEIFDSFACDLIHNGRQAYVQDWTLHWARPEDKVAEVSQQLGIQRGEIGWGYEQFAGRLAQSFENVDFLTFDYGTLEPRQDFSVRIFREHEVYSPFEVDLARHYKTSDITYDVNFSHLLKAFQQAGFRKRMFVSQMTAMREFGLFQLVEIMQKHLSHSEYIQEMGKVKTLFHPSFLGERFKVLNVSLGMDGSMSGRYGFMSCVD